MDSRAIGVFDSGIGGLSIWRAVRERLPHESIIYLGDGENCPYGELNAEQITTLATKATEHLIAMGCKLIVVACNTATIASIAHLRKSFDEMLFVGVEPAVKPACLATRSGKIGVLATEWSISRQHYMERVGEYRTGVEVVNEVGRGFVELVEDGKERGTEAEAVVRPIIESLINRGVDQIVLGCTHYPLLGEVISRVIGSRDVELINPAPSVAKQVERLLSEHDLLGDPAQNPSYNFITFASDNYAQYLRHRAEGLIVKGELF